MSCRRPFLSGALVMVPGAAVAAPVDPFGPAVSPLALIFLAGAVWLYLRGARNRRLVRERVAPVRHLWFLAGAMALALSYNAPLAPAGQGLFTLHQVQHFLIRLVGPMLLVLAYPWPVLRAGLPSGWRRWLWRAGRGGRVATTLRGLTRLDVSFALFLGSLVLWQVPVLHNAALASPALTVLAHLGMTCAGILFFGVVLDRRDDPPGATRSLRLLALVGGIVSNILLGSLTTLKEVVVYTGYGTGGRLWGLAPLADETIGGYVIWVPSSLVFILAIILAFNGWNAAEIRRWNARGKWRASNAAALEFPETAKELMLKTTGVNRRMRLTLFLLPPTIFAIVMVTISTIVYLL